MCMGGGGGSQPQAQTPAAAPAPAPDAPTAPIVNADNAGSSKVAAANQAGKGGLRVDLASSTGPMGGAGLNIPVSV